MNKETENACCYPDCKAADSEAKDGFCLEHAKLARFIIDMVHANFELGDFL